MNFLFNYPCCIIGSPFGLNFNLVTKGLGTKTGYLCVN